MQKGIRLLTILCGFSMLLNTTAFAETLVLEIETGNTPFQRNMPDGYEDLRERLDANPRQGEMSLRIYLPDFENYANGTHEISLNVGNTLNWGPTSEDNPDIPIPGLAMTMVSPTLGALEGNRGFTRTENAAGEEVGGMVLLPDESQLADYGTITISNGRVTRFTYGWVEADNPGLVSMTAFYTERRDFPIGMTKLTIDVSAFSDPARIGDLVMVTGLAPDIQIDMGP